MRRSIFWRLLLVLTVLAGLAAGCTPKSATLGAMLGAAQAVRDRDFTAFKRYVDVEALVDQVADKTLVEVKKKVPRGRRQLDLLKAFAKPLMVKQATRQVKVMIENGEVEKRIPGLKKLPAGRVLQNTVRLFGAPQNEDYYEIVEVDQAETRETLTIKLRLKATDPWLTLKLRSHRVEDHYRIDKIVNLDDLYDKLVEQGFAGLAYIVNE